MRRFEDADGRRWDAVIGRASWGTLLLLFVPAGHDADVRQALLAAASPDAAQQELDDMSDDALNALLVRSTVKED